MRHTWVKRFRQSQGIPTPWKTVSANMFWPISSRCILLAKRVGQSKALQIHRKLFGGISSSWALFAKKNYQWGAWHNDFCKDIFVLSMCTTCKMFWPIGRTCLRCGKHFGPPVGGVTYIQILSAHQYTLSSQHKPFWILGLGQIGKGVRIPCQNSPCCQGIYLF